MPTYEYRCKDCGEPLEAVQSFSDDPLEVCPSCGGRLRKVFGSVGISFKGSGFYKTDSRSSSGSKVGSSDTATTGSGDSGSGSSASSDTGSGGSKTSTSSESSTGSGNGSSSTSNGSTSNGSAASAAKTPA